MTADNITPAPKEAPPRGTDWEKDAIGVTDTGHIVVRMPGAVAEAVNYAFTSEGLRQILGEHYKTESKLRNLERQLALAEPHKGLAAIVADLEGKAAEADLCRIGSSNPAGKLMFGQVQAYRDAAGMIRQTFGFETKVP